jgi:predicted Zn-dependent peptidase
MAPNSVTRVAATLFVFIAAVAAQPFDRTKPPETPPLAAYKLPPVTEYRLGNGLSIVTVEDKRFPLVTVRLGFAAGSKYDPKNLDGLSSMTASLLKEGTKTRSSRQIAEELAAIGGSLDAGSSEDALTLSGNALSDYAAKLLELTADLARNASFPEDEVKLRKANREQELVAARADASTLAEERFRRAVFGTHPYANVLPTPDSVERITRESLVSFRDAHLIPNQAVLILVGNLPDKDALRKMIEQRFGDWSSKPAPAAPAEKFPAAKREIILLDRPGSAQADIRIGQLAVNRPDPDHFPVFVTSNILGGGASSRLFQTVREREGYAYDAHTENERMKDAGVFAVVTSVRDEVVEPALRLVLEQLDALGKQDVGAAELTDAKNLLAGGFVISMETQSGVAGQLAVVKLNGLPNDYLENMVTRYRSVEPDQIKRAARKYVTPEDAAIVVVGDAQKIKAAVEKIGPVTVEKAK